MTSAAPVAIESTGLVTSVGLSAAASCAAFRAKVSNPTETRFMGSDGEWIMAHQVPLEEPWRGLTKLAKMAATAIDEALQHLPKAEWGKLPMLLCVAEKERPGRMAGLDDQLFLMIQEELGVRFAAHSMVITQGRVGVGVALAQARALMVQGKCERVLVAASDTLVTWSTLSHYVRKQRLLTGANSNGFVPGEGAGATLVGHPTGQKMGQMLCFGIGFGLENAHIDSEQPLRGDGLSKAIKGALAEAGCEMHHMDLRIADLAGEQYYFKEAALALARTLRGHKEEFDIWHPAECAGEVGAVAGLLLVAQAHAAFLKRYAAGSNVLIHMSNDAGQRTAMSFRYGAYP